MFWRTFVGSISAFYLFGHRARKVRGVVDIATALVRFDLRIHAERTRESCFAAYHFRRGNLGWRNAFLNPLLQRGERVERSWTRATGAMVQAGYHEETQKFLGLGFAALIGYHAVCSS